MIQHPDEDRAAARGQLGDHILIRSWRCGLRRLRPLPASADARYYRSELVSWKRIDRESPLAYVFPTEFANPGLVAGTPADLRPVKYWLVSVDHEGCSSMLPGVENRWSAVGRRRGFAEFCSNLRGIPKKDGLSYQVMFAEGTRMDGRERRGAATLRGP